MSLARYFVFKNGREWIVSLDGAAIGRHGSRHEAIRSAIVMADLMGSMQHEADVMVERALGVAWSYGTDPLPEAKHAA